MGLPPEKRRSMGQESEQLAREYLQTKGYRIIETNFYYRGGELDIIAWHENVLCFIEVRSVSSERYGSPLETISYAKRRRLIKTAQYYLFAMERAHAGKFDMDHAAIRFDVLGIVRHPLRFALVTDAIQNEA